MYNIIIFGDSISAGRKIRKKYSWPSLLANTIDQEDKANTLVHNLSIPSNSTQEILERFPVEANARCQKESPDDRCSIIFAVGINDAKAIGDLSNINTAPDTFEENIRRLVKMSQQYTKNITFVGPTIVNEKYTTPIGESYFLNKNILKYNNILQEATDEYDLPWVEIAKDWINSNYQRLLTEDGIHPSRKGHRDIFEKIVHQTTLLKSSTGINNK